MSFPPFRYEIIVSHCGDRTELINVDVVDSIKLLRLSFPPEIHPPPLFIPRRYDRSFSNTSPLRITSFHRFYHPLIATLAYLYDDERKFLSIRFQLEIESIVSSPLDDIHIPYFDIDLSYIYIHIFLDYNQRCSRCYFDNVYR